MAETLARLPMAIEILSPVHVGNGDRLGRKSFVTAGDHVHVADERKLLDLIGTSPQLQAAFVRFCEEPGTWLGEYLKKQRVPVESVRAYTLRLMGQSPREILPFIKVAGVPPRSYLPGSSIKGALRGALLRSALLDDESLRVAAADRIEKDIRDHDKQRSPGFSVEQEFFGPNQHHDLMRIVQVADSQAISPSRLQVAEVQTLSSIRGSLQPKHFILSPEVLPPGLRLRGEVVFNAYLISGKAQACGLQFGRDQMQRLLDFIAECNRAAGNLIAQEIDFFTQHNERDMVEFYQRLQIRLTELQQGTCLLRLGWGTGYDDKAVTDVFDERLFDDVRETYGLPVGRPRRRGPGLPKDLSPKSRKIAFRRDGPPQPLGWMLLRM